MRSEDLLESSTDGIFAFDKDLQLTICNKKIRKLLSLSNRTWANKPLLDSIDLVDREAMNRVLSGDSMLRNNSTYFVKQHSAYLHFDLELTPVRNEKKEISGGMGVLRNIQLFEDNSGTNTRKSEDSNDYLLPKIVFDLTGNPIFFNDSYRELWSITPKVEKYVLDHYNLFEDEQLSAYGVSSIMKDQVDKGYAEIPIFEYDTKKTTLLRTLALKQKTLSGYIQPQKNKRGEINSIEVTLLDMSLDHHRQKLNSNFYEKFQKFTKNLPSVIYEHVQQDEDRNYFRYISKNCIDLFGLSDVAIQHDSRLLKGLIHADDMEGYLQSVKIASDEFAKWEWEGRYILNGQERWIRAISRPEREESGHIVRYGMLTDVTTEKTALINEETATQRLQLALQGGGLGLWDWFLNTGEIVTNDRFVEIIGYDLKDLSAKGYYWLNHIHEEERELVRNEMILHVKGKSDFFDIEMRVKTITNTWQWIHTRGQVTESNDDGRAVRITGTIQNIDKRKYNEQTLSESESRYRDLIEHSPLAITVHCEGKIVFANEQTGKLLGASNPKELIGRNVLDFVHEDDVELSKKRMAAVYNNGQTAPMIEEKFVQLDGKEVIAEVVGIPYKYEGKRAIQVIARDVTEKRNTEVVLKRSEQLLSQLFENVPIGIVLLDEKRRVLQINKGFEGIFGYDNNEAFGKKLNELIIPNESRGESINLTRLITEGEVIKEVETTRKTKDGRLVPVMIYGLPVKLKDKVIAVYGIYVDVTASKKVEGELKIRNEELDNFVYKVSHDLRAPLSSTLGLIHLTKLEGNNADLKQYIDLIEDRISQLDRFITDVLSHSKNLNVDVVNEKIDFDKIIHNSFDELNYLPGADIIKREISIDQTEFVNDHWRISEVLRNLISNAIKYLNPQIDDPFIKIRIKIDEQSAEIYFEDNGIGIAENLLGNVFEMFYRATEFSEGSGIGLYIVKNAIVKMGGEIELESVEYEGTKFHISLPNK
jgi:PAS domain S-box-containing protein